MLRSGRAGREKVHRVVSVISSECLGLSIEGRSIPEIGNGCTALLSVR
jgi:hypothetical protein